MDSPPGQHPNPAPAPPGPTTRDRLLTAAAELIGEVGWDRVTTRSVAARAGLPHGAFSYHFDNKQQLLTQAAMATVEQAMPAAEILAAPTADELLGVLERWLSQACAQNALVARVGVELLVEAGRDPVLQTEVQAILDAYRKLLTKALSAHADGSGTRNPEAVAILVAALMDGLFVHARIDPGLDIGSAIGALREMLRQ